MALSLLSIPSALLFVPLIILLFAAKRKDSSVRVIAIGLVSKCIDAYLRARYPIKDVLGRKSLPTCPYEWPNGQGDVGKFLQGIENSGKWESQHGSLYRIWSGMSGEVVLTRPEHLLQTFKDSDKHIKATNNDSGWLMSQVLGQCVGLVSGEDWRKVRAITEVPFQHKAVKNYVFSVQRCVQQYMQDLREHARLSHGILDPAGDMKMLPFFVVAEIIYGELSPDMVADLRKLAPTREHLFKYVISGGLARYSWSRFLPTAANRTLREFKQAWRAFNQRVLARARLVSPQPPIVDMYAAVDDGTITEEQLLQTLDESLYANLDVTTGALSWNIVWLASSPKTRQRLREEIRTFRHQDQMDQYLLSNQTLLTACILESSRLKPLAAFSVPQAAPSERVLDGWVIPANTNFVVDSHALNIRNEYWGADRTEYRPDRFFDLKTKDLRYHFWRFGFGPRQCMGKYVADLMIRSLLVHLLENYELDLPAETAEWKRDPESWILHPQMELKCIALASPEKGT